ncbi:Glycosyltransferase involved in cell wall bisynthesis [Pseudonocardia thermophila]|uniref:Glycosyltransferase involved in cell wall bisynthesis n=1 Tax=Pseudonocardia thermophila TaxID=1848 RepID=A0A1M6YUN8_PSETH|nr:glycosyltransferase [Pseudonocardia thermophila]SHL22021.1 Glycosyltransferase involved in cell wall bisynthesis [Pseudonocardia thermophila]
MKILVVHNRYRSGHPSGEDRVVDQERALLAAAGHDVDLFGRASDDIARMPLPQKALVPLRVPWNPAVRTELAAHLRRTRPDVVHVHSTFPLLSASVVAACADADVPAVATLHNYGQVCATGTLHRAGARCTQCIPTRGAAAVWHGCYRNSRLASVPVALALGANRQRWRTGIRRFLCISAAQRDLLVAAGMPGERLVVQHNIVPEPPERRTGPGEHVLFLGRLSPEKGVPVLLRAWERIGPRLGLPLLLVGSGTLDDTVAAWAAGRADVRMLGLRSRAECAHLVARATAVVAPSVWPEAFGLVAVEAMAAGVPVVAAASGALPEIVEHRVTGLLHEPGDAVGLAAALAEVVEPACNAALGHAARADYLRRFAPEVGVPALVAQYEAAIAGR